MLYREGYSEPLYRERVDRFPTSRLDDADLPVGLDVDQLDNGANKHFLHKGQGRPDRSVAKSILTMDFVSLG
jgi:hypothetical protein